MEVVREAMRLSGAAEEHAERLIGCCDPRRDAFVLKYTFHNYQPNVQPHQSIVIISLII